MENVIQSQASKNPQTHTRKSSWAVPAPGCYVPAITFFNAETDELDLVSQSRYFSYLSTTGLRGIVVLGTNAETFLLSREERRALLECARAALPDNFPIIAGVSGHSTSQVQEYISDAYEAGANSVLLLPCAYFGKQTTNAVVKNFYAQITATSPLPIILYNFPAVCNGLDMDSELITEIAKQSEKVVGVKLTCGSVAKIARLAATFPQDRFAVFGGQSDFLLGGLAVGSAGCIAAFANVFPRSVARLFDLWAAGRSSEAFQLQQILALAESPTKAGIANTKYAAAIMTASRAGIVDATTSLRPRRPYDEPVAEMKSRIRRVMEPLKYLEGENGDRRESRL
jgi:4-hydroxy-2-oxoglutarate aldolase